jgi:DNA-binding protein Fis
MEICLPAADSGTLSARFLFQEVAFYRSRRKLKTSSELQNLLEQLTLRDVPRAPLLEEIVGAGARNKTHRSRIFGLGRKTARGRFFV